MEVGGKVAEGKEPIVCVNGEYLPRSKAGIDPFDYGWKRGWVLYVAPAVWKGSFFKLDVYLDRLWETMAVARINPPRSRQEIKEAFLETVRRNDLRDAQTWIYVSAGMLPGAGYLGVPKESTFLIIATSTIWYCGIKAQETGVRAIISSYRSLPPQCVDSRLKHLNRLCFDLSDVEAEAAGADAAILLGIDGYVTENNASNIFTVKNGSLYTPAEGVLEGVTQETIFEIAHKEGIPASRTNLKPYDLYIADEVFFTTTGGGTVPVVEISGRQIGDGKPGPMAKRLKDIYFKMRESGEYSTPVYS